MIERITTSEHELASHGYYHSDFKPEHLLQSKLKLQELLSLENGSPTMDCNPFLKKKSL